MKSTFTFRHIIAGFVFLLVAGMTQAQIVVNTGINNQTFNTCDEFIIDSGGQGGPGYSNGENITFTICSDNPGDQVTVTFNLFSLSTQDTNPNPNVNNSDQMYVFDGPNTSSNSLGNYGGTGLQGVVIQATPQNTSGCLTFQFISNDQGTGSFTASASCNTPCATPQAGGFIVDGLAPDSVRTCVGEPVFFQESGSFAQTGFNLINYTWDFMDGTQQSTTTPGAQVQHSFSQPGQYLVQLFVQDDNPDNVCLNSNFISLQVFVATIPSFIGFQEDVTLCLGEELEFAATPELYEVTWDGFIGDETIENGCLPDTLLGISQNIDIYQMGFLAGTTIESIDDIESICLDMEHSFMGDLVIYVTCPNGQQVMLHQQGGGGTQIGVPNQLDNIDCDDPTTQGEPWHYCFTPTATQTWVEWVNNSGFGGTLPEGDYEPVAPLDGLIGCPTNGIWTLTVVDNWAADDGQLVGFSLNLDPSLYPDVVEFTPEILPGPTTSYWNNAPFASINDTNLDQISILPTAAGEFTYTYTVVDDFGCTNDTSFVLTVFDAVDVTAPADFGIACDVSQLQGWYEGYTVPACAECVEDETYCYATNDNFTWTFCLDDPGTQGISFHFTSGQMGQWADTFTAYNGPNTSSPMIESWTNGDATGMTWTASSGCITIQFSSFGWMGTCADGTFTNWIYSVQPSMPNAVAEWAPDGYEWSWTPATPLDDGSLQAPTIVNLTSLTTFTVTGYPVGHPLCASSDEVTVNLDQNQDAGDDNVISVCMNVAPFEMRDSLNGTPYVLGQWMDAGYNPLPDGIFDPAVDVAGVYYHYIPAGCDTAKLTIGIIPQLQLSAANDTTICTGGAVDMNVYSIQNGLPPYNYNWTYDGVTVGNAMNVNYSPLTTGTACIDVTEGCNYLASQCFQVDVLPGIDVVFTVDTTASCWPHTFEFVNTTDPTLYTSSTWEISDGTLYSNTTTQMHNFAQPGEFPVTLRLKNAQGCDYASSDTVTAWTPPVAGYIPTPQPTNILDTEISFTDASEGHIVSWTWDFGDLGGSHHPNPVLEFPNDAGDIYPITLEVVDVHNCNDFVTGEIVINDILSVYVPNTFTPNGDGVNDVLFVEGADIDNDHFHFMVFNRFGDKIFESKDVTLPWVGDVHNGEYFAPDGAYNWRMVVFSKTTGTRKELTGVVSLVR